MGLSPETPKTIDEHANSLVDSYTGELTAWADEKVPAVLLNGEYAARTSALMIAMTRQLARAAAAFGEANNVDPEEVSGLVVSMFVKNHVRSLDAIDIAKTVN